MIRRLGLSVALGVLTLGCSSSPPEPEVPEKSNVENIPNTRAPISQVRQTLNLLPEQTFQATLNALQRRGVPLAAVQAEDGMVETGWIETTDSLCGGHRMSQAPLGCRARISVKIEPLSIAASTLNIRYEERCAVNEEIPVNCPDSSVERLMLSVVEEIRQVDAKVVNPGVRRSAAPPSRDSYTEDYR